jgi:glycosyltransferase involved in cell wall biosynthesis
MSMENRLGKVTMTINRRGRLGASPELLSKQYPEPGLGTLPATFSIIIPTCGRVDDGKLGLQCMLDSLLPQLGPNDEIIVISDGPIPETEAYVKLLWDNRVRYFTGPKTNMWGNQQRNFGIRAATKDYLLFCDDDDAVTPDYLDFIRACCKDNPGRLVCFWMKSKEFTFGKNHLLNPGQIGGPMMAVPNIPERLGTWNTNAYTSDYLFQRETRRYYKEDPIWIDRVLYLIKGVEA